jgi:aspartate 1-decarboxylase
MKGLFNPVDTVSRQFKNGLMGTGVLGYEEINMSQSIKQFTTGSRSGTITVDGTMTAQGSTKITLNGTTGHTLAVGDVFTIANVYAVNPQTRESTGSLQQFVVTAANTAAASKFTDVNISPAIYTAANALATVDSFPVNLAAVTFVGSASTQYPQNLIYHKDAITFATADLMLPQGVDMASRQVHNGISLRIVRQYDINNDRLPCRIDVLYGFSVIRPQMAVRLWG